MYVWNAFKAAWIYMLCLWIIQMKKYKETEISRYIDENELNKPCFQHDIVYGAFKDLNRTTFPHKVLTDKAFNIAKDPKYDGYQRRLASIAYKFFD